MQDPLPAPSPVLLQLNSKFRVASLSPDGSYQEMLIAKWGRKDFEECCLRTVYSFLKGGIEIRDAEDVWSAGRRRVVRRRSGRLQLSRGSVNAYSLTRLYFYSKQIFCIEVVKIIDKCCIRKENDKLNCLRRWKFHSSLDKLFQSWIQRVV